MASKSFILWLHGLGDSGPANEPIKSIFTSPQFKNTRWSFPSAPNQPVTCNYGSVMPSWFDIHEIPITANSPVDESSLLKAVQNVHSMIDKEVAAGVDPKNVFICGFSQGDGSVMPSWFDIHEIPITANSPVDESSLLKAVQNVHSMIDKEVAAGVDPKNVFICGFSQGGALTLASVLLYPKTLGGGAVFSGWVPFNSSSIIERITPDAKRTPILWSHGIADGTVLFEAGQAGPPLLQHVGMNCEFKAYPGLAHSLNNQEFQHLESWIKSRLQAQMATKGNLGEVVTHARGLGFKPRREGFSSGAKKEWGLSPKAKVRVLHTAQLDVTVAVRQEDGATQTRAGPGQMYVSTGTRSGSVASSSYPIVSPLH
nr:probable carboxylesterase SOBER1-like [Tanacetum cinerariifolium]